MHPRMEKEQSAYIKKKLWTVAEAALCPAQAEKKKSKKNVWTFFFPVEKIFESYHKTLLQFLKDH